MNNTSRYYVETNVGKYFPIPLGGYHRKGIIANIVFLNGQKWLSLERKAIKLETIIVLDTQGHYLLVMSKVYVHGLVHVHSVHVVP